MFDYQGMFDFKYYTTLSNAMINNDNNQDVLEKMFLLKMF